MLRGQAVGQSKQSSSRTTALIYVRQSRHKEGERTV